MRLRQAAAALAISATCHAACAAELVSPESTHVLRWVLDTHDNGGAPFVIVDKLAASLRVFDAAGKPLGTAPVLLGAARGDSIVPGTEDRPLSQIARHERVTPAGRFFARRGRNHGGEEVIWVDVDAGISMHRLRAVSAAEHRMERLLSPTPSDNRISYGCINVPAAFYDAVLVPAAGRGVVVYVLPETRPAAQWFGFGST